MAVTNNCQDKSSLRARPAGPVLLQVEVVDEVDMAVVLHQVLHPFQTCPLTASQDRLCLPSALLWNQIMRPISTRRQHVSILHLPWRVISWALQSGIARKSYQKFKSLQSQSILYLAGSVQGQDLGPDEDERLPQVCGSGLQQLEDVGVDSHTESQVHSPRPHVQEVAQQPQGSQPMHLTQQNLHKQSSHCALFRVYEPACTQL